MPDPRLINGIYFVWKIEFRISVCDYSVYDYHLSRSDAASDQAAEDVEDDERNAAGSAEN